MKKVILFFFAFALLSTGVFAQGTKKATKAKAAPVKTATATKATAPKVTAPKVQGPDMTFESMTVDFGSIEQDADPFRFAKFTNNGTEPLLIKSANGSCGCTVPTWPQTPILPGESGEIKVRYDTHRVGPINKTVTVNTNIEGKSFVLSVKGDIKAKAADASVPAGTKNMLNKG
ncbi:MAG TPA: DUF1573 domain-containing protein [Saprospiraceae bacterium]|nr:DUF1573 domain-containing protein [Saprospiraceae bacterium]